MRGLLLLALVAVPVLGGTSASADAPHVVYCVYVNVPPQAEGEAVADVPRVACVDVLQGRVAVDRAPQPVHEALRLVNGTRLPSGPWTLP